MGSKLSNVIFSFGTDILPLVIKELEAAEKYVRIAVFQMHHEDVFKSLSNKINSLKIHPSFKVEILTLPYDSINEDVRPQVEQRFRELEKNGAKLYFNRWNVGDPSRTTTAVGRWYSFHGKFIVTDKSAIALSANLTQNQELDAAIIFRGIESRIKEFNEKFDELLKTFVIRDGEFEGNIHSKIAEAVGEEIQDLFELPKNVDVKHREYWIRHYPMVMCPSSVAVQEKLYITPFDCKGRDFMCQLIEDANEYAYISTESFTDEEFSNFLRNTSINRKIDLRILSGATSMDFTDRIGNMFRDLLAQGIDVNTTDEEMHAKLIITDKTLAVSSINLNKMNLGFKKTRKYWRENTESIVICKDPDLIKLAKEEYLKVFRESHSVREKLYEKLEKTVKEVFKGAFRLHPDPDVRTLFARLILDKQLDVRKLAIKIGKTTKKLMDLDGRKKIKKEDFFAALTLLSLSQGKQSFEQLKREIDKVEGQIDLMAILDQLRSLRLIDEDTGYYKIGSEVSL